MNCCHVTYTKKGKIVKQRGVAKVVAIPSGKHLGLRNETISPESRKLIDDLATRLHTGSHSKPSKKAVAAVGAVVADLLRIAGNGPNAYAFRDMSSGSFTDEAVGAHCVRAGLAGMKRHKLIRWRSGTKATPGTSNKGDRASQFYIEETLLDAAAAFGIMPQNWPHHFRQRLRPKVVRNAVQLRKSRSAEWHERAKRGEKMKVDFTHSKVIQSKRMLDDINRHFFPADIKIKLDGENYYTECFYGFRRIFCRGDLPGYNYNKGGRIYPDGGGYQNATKVERGSILINGEPTNEIDIRGCQLAILHAKIGEPLNPDVDPYLGIGTDRGVAKACVMQILGSSDLPSKWSVSTAKSYGEDNAGKCLYCDHPFKDVLAAVVKQFPVFKAWKSAEIDWGDLQFADSEVMLETVHTLATVHGVIALPVHDPLIIARKHECIARQVLTDTFTRQIGVSLFIK